MVQHKPGQTQKARATVSRMTSRVLSDGSLTKKASLNAMASGIDYAARLVVGLLVSPILLTRLGDAGFGVWQVLQKLIGHAGPASGRPGEALKWVVASKQSSQDLHEKRQLVGNAVAVWFLFLPVIALVGAVLGWFAPIWLHVPSGSYTSVRIAAAILVADLIMRSLTALPQAVLEGENMGYKRVGLSTTLVFVGGLLTVLAAVSGGGLVAVAMATLATTILSGAMYLFITRSRVAWFGIAKPSIHAAGRFVRLSGWFLLWNLVMLLMKGGDVIVLGIAGSATLVTSYTLTRYVPEAITAIVALMIFAVMPGLGGVIGAGQHERAIRVRSETMSLAWLMATVAGAMVLVWERSFLTLWVGPGYYPGMLATLLIVTMVLQFALIRTDSNIIDLTLNLRWKTLLGLLSAVMSMAIGWVLVSAFGLGIVGLATGFIAGRSIISVAYPTMIGRFLRIRPQDQVRGMVRPGLVTLALFATAAWAGLHVDASSWLMLVLSVGMSVGLVGVAAFFCGLGATRRGEMVERVREMVAAR